MSINVINIEIPLPCNNMGCTEQMAYSIGNSDFSMPGHRWNICTTCYESLKEAINGKCENGTNNLSDMSKQELLEVAKEKGIKVSATISKASLIEELEKC